VILDLFVGRVGGDPPDDRPSAVWRPVDGRYEASNTGEIRNRETGRVLRPRPRRRGYVMVAIQHDGVRRDVSIHVLVAEVFHGPRPSGHEVNHKNGIHGDNRASNLEWVTPEENRRHQREVLGRWRPAAKLSETDVAMIRSLAGSAPQREIAERFGVGRTAVQKIMAGTRW